MKMTSKKVANVLQYNAIFEPNIEGGYEVRFPDFPDLCTFGDDFEHAKLMAEELLSLWVEEMVAQKKRLPRPSSLPLIDVVRTSVPVGRIRYATVTS